MALRHDVLVVDSGGRGHALGWKLSQSPEVDQVYYARGNGGTSINLQHDDIASILRFCKEKADRNIVVVIGSEAFLAAGYADSLKLDNVPVFGWDSYSAKLESSKAFSKEFMVRNGIPTPEPYGIFDSPIDAIRYVNSVDHDVVVKANGLARGKGVYVCDSKEEAVAAIRKLMIDGIFGVAGNTVVIERRISGIELSYMIISDGKTFIPLATSQDHKRLGDGDTGPNTGGMGAYSPNPLVDELTERKILRDIVVPTMRGMQNEELIGNGILYFGIMLTDEGHKLLEINVRFGDPECQAVLFRLESDLFPYVMASISGTLGSMPGMDWYSGSSATIVLASRGYPESYTSGEGILGVRGRDYFGADSFIFHSGTELVSNSLVTAGGRVLSPTARGDTLEHALYKANTMAERIDFNSKVYRKDIGRDGLEFYENRRS